jgi:4'-phosphopantetheinyl transferase
MIEGGKIVPGTVHIYRVRLDDPRLHACRRLLSDDEILRADRFRFPLHRDRFIAGRAALRILLAQLIGKSPQEISFAYTENGKPYIPDLMSAVTFNVSNSEDLCLIAVGPFAHIGVDIEHISEDREFEDMARRFFSAGEATGIMQLPEELRAAAFFACWTRKEAFVKAHGVGLVYGLDQFEVAVSPNEPTCLLSIAQTSAHAKGLNDPKEWSLFNLNVDDGFAAALAVHGSVQQILELDWECPENMGQDGLVGGNIAQ